MWNRFIAIYLLHLIKNYNVFISQKLKNDFGSKLAFLKNAWAIFVLVCQIISILHEMILSTGMLI